MALTLSPNTPQNVVVGQPVCFTGSGVLSIPQEDRVSLNLAPSGLNWTYNSVTQTFKKVSGTNENYADCDVIFDPGIFGTRPFYFEAANTTFTTPGGSQNNFSMYFGLVDDDGQKYGYELIRYCNSNNTTCDATTGTDWLMNIYWRGRNVFATTSGGSGPHHINFNEIFYIESTGGVLKFHHIQGGVDIVDLQYTLPVTSAWRFEIKAAFVNNALGYLSVFKGTYQGSIPITWSTPLGGALVGTPTNQCFTAPTTGLYQVCIDSDFDDPVCVDVQAEPLYFAPTDFDCGGCVFTGDTINFNSNGGLAGTLEVTVGFGIPVGTIIDALTWKAPDFPVVDAQATYTLGDDTVSCFVNVVPRLEVLNIEGDTIAGLIPGDIIKLQTNYELLDGEVVWENVGCDNLVSPDGTLVIPTNYRNSCFGKIDCYIRVKVVSFPAEGVCPNLAIGGSEEYFQDFHILVDPVYPTPSQGGPNWVKWKPETPDFRVLSKVMEGGCSETHIRNRVPIQRWTVNYSGLSYTDDNDCPVACCEDPAGFVNGFDPRFQTAKLLDDFFMLTAGQFGYFTLIDPKTGYIWKKVRFDKDPERDHINWRTIHSRNISLVWNPCCANEPAGGVCPHSTILPDIYPPSIPENLNVFTVSYSELKITWEESIDNVGIQYYELSIDGDIINIGNVLIYYDKGLEPSSTHEYKVQALDYNGNPSGWSNLGSGTTSAHDDLPPAIPQNLRGSPIDTGTNLTSGSDTLTGDGFTLLDEYTSDFSINVAWDSVADGDLAGYYLLVGGIVMDVGLDTSYLDSNLEACTQYSYYVRSYDNSGNKSHWSDELLVYTNCGEFDIVEGTESIVEGSNTIIES